MFLSSFSDLLEISLFLIQKNDEQDKEFLIAENKECGQPDGTIVGGTRHPQTL